MTEGIKTLGGIWGEPILLVNESLRINDEKTRFQIYTSTSHTHSGLAACTQSLGPPVKRLRHSGHSSR